MSPQHRFAEAMKEAAECDSILAKRREYQRKKAYSKLGSNGTDSRDAASAPTFNFSASVDDRKISTSSAHDTSSVLLTASPEAKERLSTDGPLPPFFGVPCTTKEAFALKGFRHSAGLLNRKDTVAASTSLVILRMQEAGALEFFQWLLACLPRCIFQWLSVNARERITSSCSFGRRLRRIHHFGHHQRL